MTSDANASDAKLKEAAAAPGAWRVVDWKVRGGGGGYSVAEHPLLPVEASPTGGRRAVYYFGFACVV